MSNARAIATVTATLRHSLQNAINADLPGATVTSVRPDGAGSGIPPVGVNIFLYQISPNAALRNADLPSRSQDGTLVQRARAALDLHYLFSFYGDEAKLEPQQLAGTVARTLHERAMLTRKMITAALAPAGAFNFLNPSDLADETETVRLTPLSLSLEEMAKLWSVFFQTSYALSVAYQASVVLIESSDTPRTPLPVRERTLAVLPFRAPRIDDVISEHGAGLPILAGSSITVRGQQLRGEVTRLRMASGEITPALDKLHDEDITVPLPAGLRAGVNSVQVVQKLKLGVPPVEHSGFESNVAAFVLAPKLTTITASAASFKIGVDPTLRARQRVTLLLNNTTSGAQYSFALSPRDADTATVTFPVSGLESGKYFVRVQADGAESSLLDLNPASPTFRQFIPPQVNLP
jgi:Pvc16 N-terminal domain